MMEPDGWSVDEAADRIKRRRAKRAEEVERRRVRAREWAERVAQQLGASDRSVERIIGFGSTFETWRNYRMSSDIDLAVVGGDWSHLMRHLPEGEFEVSLVELDLQPEEFARHVESHGVVLYEKR